MAMDDRKQRVLEAIVALYTQGGEPVGSGLLCQYFDMAVASATLRNEMAADKAGPSGAAPHQRGPGAQRQGLPLLSG